jgi:uncharacterized protein (TIGR02145 family)
MSIKIFLSVLSVFFFLSCEPLERNNPYDPASSKTSWMPSNFNALLEGETIKLTWDIPLANFEGFIITKKVNNGGIINVATLPKNVNQYSDSNIVGGIIHEYTIIAYAGHNESLSLTTTLTPILPSSVLTNSPTLISTKCASLNGSITSNGGSQVSEKGFCWSVNSNPTISDNKIINQGNLSSFSDTIFGLNPNTIYYVRAYAINSKGTSYGNQQRFSTLGFGSVTDIDNNVYSTITIGSQVWMVENLKTTKYKNGTSIPNITTSWTNLQNGAYCWYNNNNANKNTYGALYNFHAVNTGNLAPNGWHIPTDSEWSTLINYLGGSQSASLMLREAGFTHWQSPNTGATNKSGFTALPGGHKTAPGLGGIDFYDLGNWAYWWSSTAYVTGYARYRSIGYGGALWGEEPGDTNQIYNGLSVRCVKD